MIRALLVDDEPMILKRLTENYNWTQMGVEIVATSGDGDEAFELICDLTPDLVITDIKMPTLSGIEMIRLLHKANIYPKFIFVTGHSDFDYTREAIRLGAYDYILKPFSPDELETTINQCVKDIRRLQDEMVNEDRDFCETLLQDYFSTSYKKDRLPLSESQGQALLNRYQLTDLAVNLLTMDLNPETSPTDVDLEECLGLIRRLNFTLGLENYFAFILEDSWAIPVITFRTEDDRKNRDFAKANTTYLGTLEQALFENLGVEANVFCCKPLKVEDTHKTIHLEGLYQQFEDCLMEGGKGQTHSMPPADEGHKYIKDALAYIRNHYGEQLRLQDVANSVYLSESHFSTLFTRHMGTSFSKYLASFRMDKAKAFMKDNPYAKVYEISAKVGYTDARYFSNLFKKTEGITPSEFVKQLF